jgi:hypothetical protein
MKPSACLVWIIILAISAYFWKLVFTGLVWLFANWPQAYLYAAIALTVTAAIMVLRDLKRGQQAHGEV